MLKRTFAALAFLALGACGQNAQDEAVSAFEGRVEDWTREIVRASPELATARAAPKAIAGDFETRLDDRSAVAEERRRTAITRRYVELREFKRRDLGADDQRTYDVLIDQFASMAALAEFPFGSIDPLGSHTPYVLDHYSSAFLALPDFFDNRVAVTSAQDAENYVARLRHVAAALDGEIARALADASAGIIPPDFILDRALQAVETILGTPMAQQAYLASLRRQLDALAPPPEAGAAMTALRRRAQALYAQAETIFRDRIYPAYQRTAQHLRAMRTRAAHEAGIWRLPNGAAYYKALLRAETTTNLTPEEIHDIGLARVRELNAMADAALRRIGLVEGSVGERLAIVTHDPQHQYPNTEEGRAQLIADINARVSAIMRRAPEWFGTLPKARMEVRRVPAALELSTGGAYYDSPALDGSKPGIYFVNLRNMAEMTKIDIPTQDYHEAVPGHHFQIALAQERENLPLLRRLMGFNAYAEGWGLYAEQLADEHDLYADDPIGRIGYIRWQLWRAARLVVDTGIHAKRWSREQAIDYIVQTTGDVASNAVTEVERYVVWPGQACGYELGRREIARLRDVARRELGQRFDLKGFHDVVLLGGEVPLTVLAQQVRDWIARRQRG